MPITIIFHVVNVNIFRYGSDSADTVDGDTATGGGEEQAVHHVTFLIEYASVVSSRSSPSPGVGPRPR